MMTEHSPTINLIAAVALDGSIGKEGKLLWKIPKDLKFYKAKTWGNVVIMGLETFKTLPKVALKGRHTIVLCNVCEYDKMGNDAPDEVKFAFNIEDALIVAKDEAKFYGSKEIIIAGGESIYRQMLEYCEYAFITWVDKRYSDRADKFFPITELYQGFEMISESIWHGKHAREYPPYKFTLYKRK
jgi:dihydrofolate reductase